mgnify:CR=1 FL=1
MPGKAKLAALARGRIAERRAAWLLRLTFHRILARRFRPAKSHGLGEIDIIARRGRTIVFVEVKARGLIDDAVIAITPQKRRRFSQAVGRWLAANPWAVAYTLRADAIFLAPRRLPRHLENAFELRLG